ncbi:adenosylcobinamide-phosphate synthase CbiB [Halanaerobacter jeridensis]|uniref:Cobalamin biosynthesis protein CobD n=1 Tax=Halanaerobacter jeridensis TaxID=706427 RepID=A0A938XSP6_9FIRM|nr:adenosylcobinamide-phosphate synthase CbiB [Halanaerobacter jeridensis]MBM7557114.1 adenosylcobinamide-phosphate synthase [Halanaerobacter jeridensis]
MDNYLLLTAIILDLIIGGPNFYPHPVVIIGRGINLLENLLRRICGSKFERIAGLILSVIIISSTFVVVDKLLEGAYYFNYYLGMIAELWILATTLAVKGLARAGNSIYQPLVVGDLEAARKKLDGIVGRDTEGLSVENIIRGTIETIAENTSDGIIAPLFYAALGGAPAAMAYKAVNTLDSMLGYKNEEYQHFGWAAAKIDDLANWIPARITGFLFAIAAWFTGHNWKNGFKMMSRDAAKHPSPNAGFPEAAVAGVLGLRLGGVNYYHGEKSFRAYLGQAEVDFNPEQIKEVLELMYWNVALFISGFYCVKLLIAQL